MNKNRYTLSLHVFRRDLRLEDNTALLEALASSERVIPAFIFDSRQIENNEYKSTHCIQFMVRSLQSLAEALQQKQGKLYCFYGIAEDVISTLLTALPINAVFINRDYTPFSRKRDRAIQKVCEKYNVDFHCHADALLHEPEQVLKPDGKPYTVFTHAYKRAQLIPVTAPKRNGYDNYYQQDIALADRDTLTRLAAQTNSHLVVKGGRPEALKLMSAIKNLSNYAEIRNFPAQQGTTLLSAHHKFGTVSIREVYAQITRLFSAAHPLITELYWRDFFTHIAYHFPHVMGQPFHEKYQSIPWQNDKNLFAAWCEGRTGFPIVDAGMRQLNETGYMHNRVRMIVASFLTKDLHIDWRLGERYFAQQLVDYDPAVNNGNWQWAASTGCDAQPYFRIFNPWLQQEKFDAEGEYIKRFVPELEALPGKVMHRLYKVDVEPGRAERVQGTINYPAPIVNHAIQSQLAKKIYQSK